jgi:hypothetical protein
MPDSRHLQNNLTFEKKNIFLHFLKSYTWILGVLLIFLELIQTDVMLNINYLKLLSEVSLLGQGQHK